MIEYNDGKFGEIKELAEALKQINDFDVKALHIGTPEELAERKRQRELEEEEIGINVRYYGETLLRIEEKLDRIIKHFNIYPIVGKLEG